jgi:hypothetical protein
MSDGISDMYREERRDELQIDKMSKKLHEQGLTDLAIIASEVYSTSSELWNDVIWPALTNLDEKYLWATLTSYINHIKDIVETMDDLPKDNNRRFKGPNGKWNKLINKQINIRQNRV